MNEELTFGERCKKAWKNVKEAEEKEIEKRRKVDGKNKVIPLLPQ